MVGPSAVSYQDAAVIEDEVRHRLPSSHRERSRLPYDTSKPEFGHYDRHAATAVADGGLRRLSAGTAGRLSPIDTKRRAVVGRQFCGLADA
jgi:hypothetical protein